MGSGRMGLGQTVLAVAVLVLRVVLVTQVVSVWALVSAGPAVALQAVLLVTVLLAMVDSPQATRARRGVPPRFR